MISIPINSSSHSYNVFIDNFLFSNQAHIIKDDVLSKGIKKIAFIYDVNCENYLVKLKDALLNSKNDDDLTIFSYSLPSGESSKSLKVIYPIISFLIENGFDRHSAIAALGGGVCGDAAGFISSIYLRGIRFYQFPTTLLSMVDSSVGGKVGINHELGKNLIGSFYPPLSVYINTDCLSSLPKREFNSGIAECIKHALISGDELFTWMETNSNKIREKESGIINELLKKNISVKCSIVETDEKESGIRAFLNLGHTFGHALEKYFNYSSDLLHGEAVSLGLIAAAYISNIKGDFKDSDLSRLIALLSSFNLPTKFANLNHEQLIKLMKSDKKSKNDKIHFVLLKSIGLPYSSSEVSHSELLSAWNYISK